MAAGSLVGALAAARRGSTRLRMLVIAAGVFGVLEVVAALSPTFWLFALLLVPIGMIGLTVNVTANSAVQMATDPAMRGRVMSLYMMVFAGGRRSVLRCSGGSPMCMALGSGSPWAG